ncbi:MAG: hypothetical protein KUG77_16435 [Nannocystaceae bacterium]|nr:hypothetical protein [Nannocystaceae bacterium]
MKTVLRGTAALALLSLALGACDDDSPSTTSETTDSAAPMATSGSTSQATSEATSNATDGGSESEAGSETTDDGFVNDSYCESAKAGYAAFNSYLEHTDAKNAEVGLGGGDGDIAIVNEEGAAAVEQLDVASENWTTAISKVDGPEFEELFGDTPLVTSNEDVLAAYEDYFQWSEVWARPEAQLAATSASVDAFSMAAFELVQQPGVAEAISAGALATGTIIAYQTERCGV